MRYHCCVQVPKTKLRVATYSRVSTSHHTQNPEIQVNELRRYCTAREWTITEEIVDHGFSGGSDVRPGLKRLLLLVRERKIDAVIVVKLDRLFRSLKHLVTTLEEFEQLGVQFVAIKDSVDWTTPAGRFFIQVLGSLAELEKSILIDRTLMGLAHAKANGKTLGRPRTGKEEAIRSLRKEGLSYRQIQERLGVSIATVNRTLKSVPKTPPVKA